MLALRRFSTAAAGTAAAASGPVTKQSSLFYRYVLSSNVTYLTFVFTGACLSPPPHRRRRRRRPGHIKSGA